MKAREILEAEAGSARQFLVKMGKHHPVQAVEGLMNLGWTYLNSEDLGDNYGIEYRLSLPNVYVQTVVGEDLVYQVKAFVRKVGYDAVLLSIMTGGLLPAHSTAGYWVAIQPVIEEWQGKMKRQPPGMPFDTFVREWRELKFNLHAAVMDFIQ